MRHVDDCHDNTRPRTTGPDADQDSWYPKSMFSPPREWQSSGVSQRPRAGGDSSMTSDERRESPMDLGSVTRNGRESSPITSQSDLHRPSTTLAKAVQCPLLEGHPEQWIRCCTCRFLPLARRVAGADDIAHDALQETWIIVLEKLHQYRGASPACGWVAAIVRHEALHNATAWSHEVPLPDPPDRAGSTAGKAPQARASWNSPEAATYTRELTRLLLKVIGELPPTFREVVRLRDVQDLPTDEVARRLHISARNVAVRLHRAHKLLRPRLLRRLTRPLPQFVAPPKKV